MSNVICPRGKRCSLPFLPNRKRGQHTANTLSNELRFNNTRMNMKQYLFIIHKKNTSSLLAKHKKTNLVKEEEEEECTVS